MDEPKLNYEVKIKHYTWEFPNGRSHLNTLAVKDLEAYETLKACAISCVKTLFYHMVETQPDDRLPSQSNAFLNEYTAAAKSFLENLFKQDGMFKDIIGEIHFDLDMYLDYKYETKDYEARFVIHAFNWDKVVDTKFINWDPDFNKDTFWEVIRENVITLEKLSEKSIENLARALLLGFCDEELANSIKIKVTVLEKMVLIEFVK